MSWTRQPLTRRSVLRGLGAAVGLPWLEIMSSATDRAGEESATPVRMAFLYMANGVNPNAWTPEGEGRDFKLSPILKPLESLKDQLLVLTNLTNRATDTGDGHYVKEAAWLCGTTIARTTGAQLNSGGTSVDQYAARRIGNLTPLPSLELGVEPVTTGVDTVVGYTRLYGSHISWSTPTTPLAKEINPKLAFDRLFRAGSSSHGRSQEDRGVLDLVREDAQSLKQRLGQGDRLRLEEYLDSVRAVEARIAYESSERRGRYRDDPEARKDIEALGGRVDNYQHDPGRVHERTFNHTEHVRLMMDIIALAFRTDSTRIASFMFGNAVSGKSFTFLEGVTGGHHQLSHHENDPAKMEQYARIGAWHVEQYAYLLDRLRSVREGEKTLLDNSMIVFGSALRDGNSHNPHNLPIVLAGGNGRGIATGRHLVYEQDTPLCNLYRAMLERSGIPADRFADSTGPLANLS